MTFGNRVIIVFVLPFLLIGCRNQGSNVEKSASKADEVGSLKDESRPKTSFRKDGVTGNGTIIVTIDGIKELKGILTVAAYNSAENYKTGGSVSGERIQVIDNRHSITFKDLPHGEYAIRVFHDVNENQKMDTNSFKIPQEPFAFSNNAKGMMGPASWEDAKFYLGNEDVEQAISLVQVSAGF